MEEVKCWKCNVDMKCIGRDDEEPLLIYKCPECGYVQYVPVDGYEG